MIFVVVLTIASFRRAPDALQSVGFYEAYRSEGLKVSLVNPFFLIVEEAVMRSK